MRFHILANIYRPDALDAARQAHSWLLEREEHVLVDSETSRLTGLGAVSENDFGDCDLVVAFGGDGTLIRAAHMIAARRTPILGVYYGRFGFVTQCRGDEVLGCLEGFLEGERELEVRMMLHVRLRRAGMDVAELYALNEVVLQRSVTARMMVFQVEVDGTDLARYPADGIIVSTPTGSTAYNLSSGGPLLDPRMEALALTPIAAHTLAVRSLVLQGSSEIVLRVESKGDSVLSVDGQNRLHILSGDEVCVRRSDRVTRLLVVEPHDFLIKLNQRMFFSQSMYGDTL